MTTPEQQAREMLGRMKVEHADYYSAGDLIELANLIAERDALKAELAAIKGAGEPFTRPAVPLTDEQIDALAVKHQHFVTTSDGQVHEQFEIFAFARAIEAHIKGAKP